ncbi:MAG TPA: hypothetical protein VE954_34900 [Oligoflexus sp.]|uniref:hypothetical protein n=1 Tax=Oligoflexus sp. TaxID=1971216 RepID=UPI002D59FF98|nr:hypothetical protein [Oligoflexus sp.]HYX38320.1 hypothetical protein [Oligoflexus sp.]
MIANVYLDDLQFLKKDFTIMARQLYENNDVVSFEPSLESSSSFVKIRYTKQPASIKYFGKSGEILSYSFPGGFIVTTVAGHKSYFAEQASSAENDPIHPERVVRWPLTLEVNPQRLKGPNAASFFQESRRCLSI